MRTISFPWTRVVALAGLYGLAGCKGDVREASAELVDRAGQPAGEATLRQVEDGVLVSFELRGLPPGEHALHVHERGKCDKPAFTSAGGHFNPDEVGHGLADRSADGAHAGDLVNVIVDRSGHAETTRLVRGANLVPTADKSSLLREGGTAIVIHTGPDDYETNPAGAAGQRIACGVIKAS